MKYKFEFWNSHRKKFMGEKSAIRRWDLWNNESRLKDFENGIINTSEDLAKENHEDHKAYEFSVLEVNDDLFCSFIINPSNKHAEVNFYDPGCRKYLTYLFTETKPKEQLFLREIWYYHFTKEDTNQEEYRMHYVFDEEGNVSARKYDDKNQKILDYESKEPMDTRVLYEPYPEFGEYEGIIKLDREIPFIEDTIKKYFFKNGKRFYKDEDGNIIED
ncbi:hypothetical protein [Aquimarina sp. RZ0]|uniref:hypothetical protein n=1 Tax=Aquimarina sp. RZ0 TaxID=2607730 RepID=UPI0011F10B36|nr:hypothetical protein [Aquimarina sp. RZ0]KAA1242346.1 hypothetical protein F0000_26035 [Aquimarina sp. RZ0]